MLPESAASKHYRSAHKRFAEKAIERFFETEFPKIFGSNTRKLIARRLIEIFNENFKNKTLLKPGQILWNAVHKDTRADSQKMKLVPVVLTIVSDEDITKLENGVEINQHKQNVIARITKEAYQQDALLSMRDISLFLACSHSTISAARIKYEKNSNETLPHTGNLQDMGSCLTHKYQIIYKCVVEKKDPTIAARETNHTIRAVDNYLKNYNRVKTLYLDNKDTLFINHVTGLSIGLIKQYTSIIDQYVKEQ